jgi:hypothetical protein
MPLKRPSPPTNIEEIFNENNQSLKQSGKIPHSFKE